jgi:hypothetical protein
MECIMEILYKRLYNHFVAKPRFSDKVPRIYLDSESRVDDPYTVDIYLVNNSPMLIDWVRVDRGYIDPEENGYSDDNKLYIDYRVVLPGDAVLIATFDEIFHSDFLNQLIFTVKERGRAPLDFNIIKKGITRLQYNVLEWLTDADQIEKEDKATNELIASQVIDARKNLERFYECGPTLVGLLHQAEHVACFYCLSHFSAAEYKESSGGVLDGFCPHCEIDALVPDELGMSLDDDSLKIARHLQFNGYADEEGYLVPWH